MDFLKSFDFLPSYVMYGTIGIVVLVVLILIFLVYSKIGSALGSKKGNLRMGGMNLMTIDTMKKKGLLTPEEAERVRKRMAERELQGMRKEMDGERERMILQEAALNPDAVLKLLSPEELAVIEARKRQSVGTNKSQPQPAEPSASQRLMGTPVSTGQPAAAEAEPEFITDPLAERPAPGVERPAPPVATPQPAQPSMNMTTVVRANQEAAEARAAGEQKRGELEQLLEKGAISQAEYERLKQFFK